MTTISLPDTLDNAGISFTLNNQAGMSEEESYTYDVVPEISSIVSVVPSDAQVKIQLMQNKDSLYETYEVTSDDGTTLMTVSAEKLLEENKVELTVTSLTNKQAYNFKVRAINIEQVSTAWITVTEVTPSKVPAAIDILSVQRYRETDIVIVSYENPVDPQASEAFTMTVTYTKLNGEPAVVSYPARVDISGNIII
jgi:precorrin-4 methylase